MNYWSLGFLWEKSTRFWKKFLNVGSHQHMLAFRQSESGNVKYPWFYSEKVNWKISKDTVQALKFPLVKMVRKKSTAAKAT